MRRTLTVVGVTVEWTEGTWSVDGDATVLLDRDVIVNATDGQTAIDVVYPISDYPAVGSTITVEVTA